MRSLFILLLIFESALLTAQTNPLPKPLAIEDSQMDTYLQKRRFPVLTIKVLNRPKEEKTEISYSMVTFGSDNHVKKYTQLDVEGNATISLEQNLPYQQLWLTIHNYLYAGIYVNTDLTVTIDASRVKKAYMIADGVQYSGTDGELNKVMNEKVLFRKKEHDESLALMHDLSIKKTNAGLLQPASKKEEAAFRKTADSVRNKLEEIDGEFLKKYPQYAWAVKNETASEYYDILCFAYASGVLPRVYKEKIVDHKPFFTSNGGVYFYRALNHYSRYHKSRAKGNLFDEINSNYAKYSSEQQALLDSIKMYENLPATQQGQKSPALNALYKKRNNLFFSELTVLKVKIDAEYIDDVFSKPKSDILKLFLLQDGKDAAEIAYPLILRNTTTAWCRKRIEEELSASVAKQKEMETLLASGTTVAASENFIGRPLQALPFGAELYKLDSIKSVDEFIVNLKSKFNGKALIIDFWATWCAPCIADMPGSKKLHDENKDLPVEYIYLCTTSDSNEDLWKKRIIEAKIPGTHVYVNDKIITELKNKFNARSGFPAYVVIDIKGKSSATAIDWMGDMDRDKLKTVAGL